MSVKLAGISKKYVNELIHRKKELTTDLEKINTSIQEYSDAFVESITSASLEEACSILLGFFDRFNNHNIDIIENLLTSYGFVSPQVDMASYSTTIYYMSVGGNRTEILHLFEALKRVVITKKIPFHFYTKRFDKVIENKYELIPTVSIWWSADHNDAFLSVKANGKTVPDGSLDYQFVLDSFYT